MDEILNYELLHIASIVITVGNIVALLLILTGAYLLLRLLTTVLRRTRSSAARRQICNTSVERQR